MSNEKVSQGKRFVVGTKQTVKAIKKGTVREVIVAKEAHPRIISEVTLVAKQFQIPIVYVDSTRKLGKAYGINVCAATVALIN